MSLPYGTNVSLEDGTYFASGVVKQSFDMVPTNLSLWSSYDAMSSRKFLIEGILLLTVVLNAWGAGIMFIFSNTIMPALSTLNDANGMTTMAAINVIIVNPLFIFVYFGGMLGLIPACLMYRTNNKAQPETNNLINDGVVIANTDTTTMSTSQLYYSKWARYFAWGAFVIHFFGCVVVTISQNVPRNDELQRLVSEFGDVVDDDDGADVSDEASEFWRNNYLTQWVGWNTARAIFGILSSIAAILSLCASRRR
mmetsp:Transcript_44020/g.106739  ORF Transcript_44020/g.106739 Transcript_44020/m.106739 type:complete len:253 (-) Transcript_44020:566-1324(-)